MGIYINPRTWVTRHRLHHAFSDHPGDPNKLSGDGFWKTLYLCISPYGCESDLARDPILKTWALRLTRSGVAVFSSSAATMLCLLLATGCPRWSLWVACGVGSGSHGPELLDARPRSALGVDDADYNARISALATRTATFSACWQNNHHHYPHLLRLSHDPAEYDFGFLTVRCMKALGLVRHSRTGAQLPHDFPLKDLGF